MDDTKEYNKIEISRSLLERSIFLFNEDRDYFSAITLAGAADEVLGSLVKVYGGVTTYNLIGGVLSYTKENLGGGDYSQKDINQILNGTRNHLKHYSDEICVHLDALSEAKNMIYRAIHNYANLMYLINNEEIPVNLSASKYLSESMANWINNKENIPKFLL